MSSERDPKRKDPSHLDDDAGRGEVSKEGFEDYDMEFHPAVVEIEGDPKGDEHQGQRSKSRGPTAEPAARQRFEVHFRMMNIRNRGAAIEDYQARH